MRSICGLLGAVMRIIFNPNPGGDLMLLMLMLIRKLTVFRSTPQTA